MDNEQIKRIIDDPYDIDDSNAYSLLTYLKDFYNRKMTWIVVFVWTWAIPCIALCIYSGIMFFRVSETRDQLLHATLFLFGFIFIFSLKVFAWQAIHRNSLRREIKRLELRVEELVLLLKEKQS